MVPDYFHVNDLYIAIDQGGHSSRALVFDFHGKLVAEGKAAVGSQQPAEDRVEQDADEMVASIESAIHQVAQQLGDDVSRIAAAGFATQRSSIACWDRRTGKPLCPIISWQDRRADKWLQQFSEQRETIHRITGLFLSAHYGASKLRWCLDYLPRVRQAAEAGSLAFGPMASFLLFRLLSNKPFLVDPANASRTLLWSLKTRNWDDQLLELFGIPRQVLPVCVPTRHDFGSLRVGNHSVPVTIVNGDQSASLFAYGKIQPDTAYVNMGTGAFVSRPQGQLPKNNRRLLTSVIYEKDDEVIYVTEGTVNGAASALDLVKRQSGLKDTRELLPQWLEQCDSPPLYMNGVGGLGSPFWQAHFDSCFIGEGTRQERLVAAVESIVFLLEANLTEMTRLASPPQQIQITGGLSQLDGLCQRLADIAGLPVYRPKEYEATARGLAYLLAESPEAWPEPGIGRWFKPQDNAPLRKRHADWARQMILRLRIEEV